MRERKSFLDNEALQQNSYNAACVRLFLEEDWERELEAELKDFEVVSNVNNKTITPMENKNTKKDKTDASGDNDDWEKRIDELLTIEDDEDDLK